MAGAQGGPIGCSSAKGASELMGDTVYGLFKEICDEENDIISAKGASGLLGDELYRACKGISDQQQGIRNLTDKRVAATGSDPSSILTMMVRVAIQVDKGDVVAFCLGRRAVVDHLHMVTVAECLSFASYRKMIEAKAVDINYVAGWYGHILTVAVDSKNLERAKFCLENGARPNISKVNGYKLVIARAAEEGFQPMVELLLDFGAELRGSGAIVLAAAAGQTEMVRWLLAKGADLNKVGVENPPNRRNEDVGTPLHRAIMNGHKALD